MVLVAAGEGIFMHAGHVFRRGSIRWLPCHFPIWAWVWRYVIAESGVFFCPLLPNSSSLPDTVSGGDRRLFVWRWCVSDLPDKCGGHGRRDDCSTAPALLVGVNIGGLGTLIASMASLISVQATRRGAPESRAIASSCSQD